MKRLIFKSRKKIVIAFLALWAIGPIALTACSDLLDASERGKKAAQEFCNCLEEKEETACEEEFGKKYQNETSDDFIDAFNKEGAKCGAHAELKKIGY
jgi:hypothetical protein